MAIRRAGLESLFPRGGRRRRRGRTQTMPDFDWSQLLSGATPEWDAPVAPPGVRQIDPTIVRPPPVETQSQFVKELPPGFKPFPPRENPWGPGGCPHPEEEILLADDSWIKAKDIRAGDKVKTLTAKDFKEGEYEITRAEIIDNQPRCEVFFKDSKSIISSYSHPYAVEDKGFVEAQDIKVGDTVGDLIVTATKPLDWGPVVSLSVDEAETYMLKAGSEDKPVAVLSHNKTPPQPPRPPGESIQAKIRQLQIQKRQLIQQIRQIDAQIHSLAGSRGFPIPWHDDTGGEPPPPPLNPPTIVRPPTIGPGTPIPQPPTQPPPWITDPPWGG